MRNYLLLISCIFLSQLITSCTSSEQSVNTRFEDISKEHSGIYFTNMLDADSKLNILNYLYYYNGAGVAATDFNGDGLDDIYFTCNECPDRLFLNLGDFKFKDVTSESGIQNETGWTSGVNHVDINGDGLEDIYISKLGKMGHITGENLLFINQGPDENGIPHFIESAAAFGLDIVAFSTQSAFFDYDLDGDLDMYLLCHSIHPNRSYGNGALRNEIDTLSGDKLFENVDGKFLDVTREAGIYQGKIGYGLGLSISDIDNNGYPDIYVGNDFFENDYLYINNGNKTFKEIISGEPEYMGHTSHYSMGNAVADFNNDGLADVVSLDMLPEDLMTLKTSGVEDPYPTYKRFLNNNYSPQYMQNTLHLNKGESGLSEVAFQSGLAATEWSWGVLSHDFDLDGNKDLFITNGILGATNDMDFINFIIDEDIQKAIENGEEDNIDSYIQKIPGKHVPNYMFRNNGDATFQNKTDEWLGVKPSFSNGSAIADFDNDGDMDLVINNVNEPATLLKNTSVDKAEFNYLKLVLKSEGKNSSGIGAKIEVYLQDKVIFNEQIPLKSYLSTSVNYQIIGIGESKIIDSLVINWPTGKTTTTLLNPTINSTIEVNEEDAKGNSSIDRGAKKGSLQNSDLTIDFQHIEPATLDFDYDPLIPFALSNEGPAIGVDDINNDGLDDILITGAKLQKTYYYLQGKNGFKKSPLDIADEYNVNEDVAFGFFDADGDGDKDLIITSAGNEFTSGKPLQPRLYMNIDGKFQLMESIFNTIEISSSSIQTLDLENDGDLDVIIGSNFKARQFGVSSESIVIENLGNMKFELAAGYNESIKDIGHINDMKVFDFDGNGFDDIVVVGDWEPVRILLNDGIQFRSTNVPETNGWWNAVEIADFDQDGDLDLVAGNWGLNSRLSASVDKPITLYKYDFDDNGQDETVITYFYQGREIFLASRDELVRQLPIIKKDFFSYKEFAEADINDVLGDEKMSLAKKQTVSCLSSLFLENTGELNFKLNPLPFGAQSSSVNDIMVDDFNNDTYPDLLLVGNNYEVSTQIGRLDASHGVLLINNKEGGFDEITQTGFNIAGPAREIKKIRIGSKDYFIIGINNGKPILIEKVSEHE